MALIALRDLGMVTPRPLFQNLTLNIGPGDRIGLVAANGAGKSTLLRCIAGQAEPDAGHLTLSRGARLGFVEQGVPPGWLGLTLTEALRRALPPAEREHESWRVGAVLDEFATPDELRDRPLAALSGGWQRLALLARTWITRPDILLLDEPTNHLDLEKIALLESWIAGPAARTPMLIASHDRSFLDACSTRTLFLRPGLSRLYAHPYSTARALLAEDDAAQERKLARDAREVTRLRRNAGELRNIGVNSGSDLLQKKSMQLRDRADRIEARLCPVHAERLGEIRLASRDTHAKVLAAIRDLTVATPEGQKLFRIAKLDLRQGDRLVLLGRNGAGKSQLIRLLRRATAEAVPGAQVSPSLVLGHTDQGMAHLPEGRTPHGFIAALPGISDGRATGLLAGAGLGTEAQARPIGRLSPGQKARLGLLALRLAEPNFYLLDEPTNHIDIPGQEQLEAELLAQGATCVLVSHDRRFVEAVGTRFLRIEGDQAREVDSA
ncbi:ABC-F family ATP-binding cassette domain-containing protein [Roseococcus sp. SYP-B2431]|uniref:ATP-binding cassette domain-containing protein n=1 Tax=Roseococcus sp. SYP-B2431 TaxID=2496640 RepID=UPI00103D6487|nr:ABC-F family ATP-binding cassette domain-containing protein [Roseococcus sp. SYP-B2431]TCH96650.1 ABC-F family ATP-binding cassette domain-containing protein [Roseococcus sp. SYP-B2431]